MPDIPMFTSRFLAVSRAVKALGCEYHDRAAMGFVPVRTSVGLPRWIGDAAIWPYIEELAPVSMRRVGHRPTFQALYETHLDEIGVERITALLVGTWTCQTPGSWSVTPEADRKPLALLCYEDVDGPDWCHRTLFAAWWQRSTGQKLTERNTPESLLELAS